MLGRFRDRILAFEPWLSFRNVIPLPFEDLIGPRGGGDEAHQRKLVWSVQLKLGAPGKPDNIAAQLFDRNSPTFHEGKIGAHLTAVSVQLKERLDALEHDVLTAFGYVPGSDLRSQHAETWRRRRLHISGIDFRHVPILIEANYLDHNLIQYQGRYYGVPTKLSAVDLATESKLLSQLVQADRMAALRAAIIEKSIRTDIDEQLGEQHLRLSRLESSMAEKERQLAGLESLIERQIDRLDSLSAHLSTRIMAIEHTLDRFTNSRVVRGLRRLGLFRILRSIGLLDRPAAK
jgi:hypothetical protein